METQPRRLKRTIELEVSVLAIDSDFDSITKAAFVYRQQTVYPYLEKKGFEVVRMQGALARRYYAAPVARQPNVEYITGVGHGAADSFLGDYHDPIFQAGDYSPAEVRGKIIHFLSCQTARELGRDFVAHGCRAFFGYDQNFIFYPEEQEIFFNCDAEIDRGFADGLTAGEVYDRVMERFNSAIGELRAEGKLYVAAALEFNRDHLRAPTLNSMWGNLEARLDHIAPIPKKRRKRTRK